MPIRIEHQTFDYGSEVVITAEEDEYQKIAQTNKAPSVVSNCEFLNMNVGGDGLRLSGKQTVYVSDCYFAAGTSDPTLTDELASVVNGSDVVFDHCYFANNGKGILVGSGDTNIVDRLSAQRVICHECVFEGNSRRNPFVQIGNGYVIRCMIKNWGIPETFHEKSYGIRAGDWGQVIVQDTLFIQEDLRTCLKRGTLLKDIFNHYFLPLLGPGFTRGAYADRRGKITCYNCYKNRPWIYLQNHQGNYMSKAEAIDLEEYLMQVVVDPYTPL